MFTAKQTRLIEKPAQASVKAEPAITNPFLQAGLKKAAKTKSGNGSEKFSTTGNDFVDQFARLGTYKTPRSYQEIERDMAALWASSPMKTVAFLLFIRLITRVTQLFNGNKTVSVQRGGGLRNEGILRMLWLHINHTDTFWKNIHLFISVGSWKDIVQMLSFDLQYNGWAGRTLNWDLFGKFILAGLENPKHNNLVKKFLPQIKSNSKCKTLEAQADNIIAKWVASLLYGSKESSSNYKKYRQLKTSGNAHEWQKLISQGKFLSIDFNTIHGRALAQLVSGKFLANNKLEASYEKWIAGKPVAKFTGYAPELFVKPPVKKYQIDTINAQFKGIVETAKKGALQATRFICVVDTSGSMSSKNSGIPMENGYVAKALALFFAEMLDKGPFANSWFEFNSHAVLHTIKGSTPWEKWQDMARYGHTGNTNFQSVVDYLIKIRVENPKLKEEDFPNGFICLSDLQFDPGQFRITNAESVFKKLAQHFSKEYMEGFKLVFWNLASPYYGKATGREFETYGDVKNVFYFSGYDGSTIAFLTGMEAVAGKEAKVPQTAAELFEAAISQEVMSYIEL